MILDGCICSFWFLGDTPSPFFHFVVPGCWSSRCRWGLWLIWMLDSTPLKVALTYCLCFPFSCFLALYTDIISQVCQRFVPVLNPQGTKRRTSGTCWYRHKTGMHYTFRHTCTIIDNHAHIAVLLWPSQYIDKWKVRCWRSTVSSQDVHSYEDLQCLLRSIYCHMLCCIFSFFLGFYILILNSQLLKLVGKGKTGRFDYVLTHFQGWFVGSVGELLRVGSCYFLLLPVKGLRSWSGSAPWSKRSDSQRSQRAKNLSRCGENHQQEVFDVYRFSRDLWRFMEIYDLWRWWFIIICMNET